MKFKPFIMATLVTIISVLSLACGDATRLSSGGDDGDDGGSPNLRKLSNITNSDIRFKNYSSCEELNQDLRDQAIKSLKSYWENNDPCGPITMAGVGSEDSSSVSSGSSNTINYTEQNSQVTGVLEPDAVFTNGNIIVVLNYDEIRIYKAWPAEELSLLSTISNSIQGKTYTFSRMILDDETLHVFGSAKDSDNQNHAVAMSFDLSDPENPVAKKERLIAGVSYKNARLRDNQLVTVFYDRISVFYDTWPAYEDYKDIDMCDDGEMTNTFAQVVEQHIKDESAEINSWEINESLPVVKTVNLTSGEVEKTTTVGCSDIMGNDYTDGSYLTIVFNQDTENDTQDTDILTMLSYSFNVYMNHDYLILQSIVNQGNYQIADDNDVQISASILHQFSLNSLKTSGIQYAATGIVPGTVPSQWAIDESDGVVRVATHVFKMGDWTQPIDVTLNVLEAENGFLNIEGQVKDLIEDEEIFAVRYVGDKVYLVTYEIFRNRDPLFVIDTSEKDNPKVLGELEMPGFSSYLQMIDDVTLMGIGQSDASCWFSWCIGNDIKVSLFDVEDGTVPTEIAQETVDTYWTSTEVDHLSVHFDSATGRLFLPFVKDYQAIGWIDDVYEYTMNSQVNLYNISSGTISLDQEIDVDEDTVGTIARTLLFSDNTTEVLYVVGSEGIQAFDTTTWADVTP